MNLFIRSLNISYLLAQSARWNYVGHMRKVSSIYSISNLALDGNKNINVHKQQFHTSYSYCKRRKTAEERKATRLIEYSPKAKSEVVEVWKGITLKELSEVLRVDVNIVKELFMNAYKSPNTPIDDLAEMQIAIRRNGKRMRVVANPYIEAIKKVDKDAYRRPAAKPQELKPRPPVVTVMGHVDHGKTTLLDALRHSSVVDQEFGGITQHIGAFSVVLDTGAKITFLDTPGHAAFTAMRERGANITDIVVLVVAADDGVMEQTLESIRMAKQANVPILVAINKIDAPKANVERTQKMLIEAGIQVEQMGGDVLSVPISALKKQNLDKLTEALILQAECLEVKADPKGPVEATVVESRLHMGRGKLCTLVVERGTLKKGAILVAGRAMAKVRSLKDAEGKELKEVPPGYPAEVEGWKDIPSAGELVLEVNSEKRAREVISCREDKAMEEKLQKDAEVISAKEEQHMKEYKERLALKRKLGRFKLRPEGPRKPEIAPDDGFPHLNLVIKADVDGTLEAILNTLDRYDADHQCKLDLVHYGVGPITENDIELAKTFNGIIYAFNVECPDKLMKTAGEVDVAIKHHNIIYKLIDDVKLELTEKLPKKEVEHVVGEANVLQQFDINDGKKKVPVAGCRCVKGNLKRAALYRLVRGDEVIHEGSLVSMRHLKSEVDSIKTEMECGLQLQNRTINFEPGDKLVCYEKKLESQSTMWDPGF